MSTIKSSAENLTLNADGSGNDIILQSNGSNVATIDQAGLVTATTFAGSGASLTALNATNLGSGTVPTARLGTGTASSGTFLRGDGAWQAAGGNLKTVTAVTTDGGSFSESAGNNKTSGSGFTLTTGANTNRIAIHLCFFAMAYDSNGAGPYSHNSLYFHDSMTANETPSGAAILLEMDYFGAYSWTGSTARHDEYFNNSLHAIATVSPSTEIFVQLCVRRGQYSDYVNVQEPRGFIMEYAQ